MTTLEQLHFNINQLWNNNHLSDTELNFTKHQLVNLLLDIAERLKN